MPGQTLIGAAGIISARLAAIQSTGPPVFVLLNWGANEMPAMPLEAAWTSAYLTVLDAIHTKWPHAQCYLMRPWRVGLDAEAATLHGWIDTVVSARSTFAFLGPDEAIWLKGADNGATNTTDGVHYSEAGHAAAAVEWRTVLGY